MKLLFTLLAPMIAIFGFVKANKEDEEVPLDYFAQSLLEDDNFKS
ncbi:MULTISPECIES: hypothetical protein [Flammeovirga]|nr:MULTISPECIES: hypothetical protein [Flammeovirga]MBB3696911.1 hypothetical protein [Flammeovirga yaeyamensis]